MLKLIIKNIKINNCIDLHAVEEFEIGEQGDKFEILISFWIKFESTGNPTLSINFISFDKEKEGLLIFKVIFLNKILIIIKYLLKLRKKDNI